MRRKCQQCKRQRKLHSGHVALYKATRSLMKLAAFGNHDVDIFKFGKEINEISPPDCDGL